LSPVPPGALAPAGSVSPPAGEPGYEYVGGAAGGSTVVPAGAAMSPCCATEVVAAVDAAATTANADSSTGSPRRPR
jgi:hypothetical protein